jgi:Flp pilus assembly protein TadG
MKRLINRLRGLCRAESGSATIEFVILFPFFIGIFSSAFEASILTTRQVMLDRAVDLAVRELRLGIGGTPTHDQLKAKICNYAGLIPNCDQSLHIELETVSTDTFAMRTGQVQCVDRDQNIAPVQSFTPGTKNELMMVTVCAVFKPMNPTSGLGLKLPKVAGGSYYGLVSISAFVNEP